MKHFYYLRNIEANFLGNSPVWYAKGGKGYTAYVMGAERFPEDKAIEEVKSSSGKYEMYLCDEIDARLHLVFDWQDVPRLGTDNPCPWPQGYSKP